MILDRLLRPLDPTTYVLIRTMHPDGVGDDAPSLEARAFTLPDLYETHPGWRRHGRFRLAHGAREVQVRGRAIAAIADAEGCDTVVGCTGGDLLDIPAAFWAARQIRARFFPYYFDYWSQQAHAKPNLRRIAELLEHALLRRADAVLVPNEHLGRDLKHRYGVDYIVVRNACALSGDDLAVNRAHDRELGAPASIVYTGAVYEANYDAFRNLIHAISSSEIDVALEIYTAQPTDVLAAQGIVGPVKVHEHRGTQEVRELQSAADILFLPLSFSNPYPRLIRGSSPAKMCEYLASGRPILVHAPADTYVATYFREHACGVVVDEPDPSSVTRALRRLLDDAKLRQTIVAAALACAHSDFSVDMAVGRFATTLGLRLTNLQLRDVHGTWKRCEPMYGQQSEPATDTSCN